MWPEKETREVISSWGSKVEKNVKKKKKKIVCELLKSKGFFFFFLTFIPYFCWHTLTHQEAPLGCVSGVCVCPLPSPLL